MKNRMFMCAVILLFAASGSYADVSEASKTNLNANAPEKETYSTNLDFDSALIDGNMKAPTGFFLQGRNKQSLSNMVRLRPNFRERLRDSKTAVKATIR
jgi:hypothetical protein